MNYLHWDEKKITDFSDKSISNLYDDGYVFTRIDRGVMQQTRSVRINLKKWKPNSENRRILKKVTNLIIQAEKVPYKKYDWSLGKLAKDFYETKFGAGIMSAVKVKEMLTDVKKSNFNSLLTYSDDEKSGTKEILGYSICYSNPKMLHYSYPFYNLENAPKDMGLGMMILAVQYAKDAGMEYIYLGSLQRPSDTYKLQFDGLEWFDGQKWSNDEKKVKEILVSNNS